MSRTFYIDELSNDGTTLLYNDCNFTFEPGITALVGCNGSGKTTLMNRMRVKLEELGIPQYNHYHHDEYDRLKAKAALKGTHDSLNKLFETMYSSEGERIERTLAYNIGAIGNFVKSCGESGEKEAWVFLDSLDSGMSIDNVNEVNELFKLMLDTKPEGLDLYIINSGNMFEMVRDVDCLDVTNNRHIKFDDYESFKDFIMKSRERKDARKSRIKEARRKKYEAMGKK